MNADQSISDFFYNIIPGSFFILLLNYYEIINILDLFPLDSNKYDVAFFIFIDLLLALFLGFIFQGITKLTRKYLHLDSSVVEKVKHNNFENYSLITKTLNKNNDVLTNFYLMDNYLRGLNPAFLANHFSSRFAFWSNTFFAIILLIIMRVIFVRPFLLDCDYALMLMFLLFSKSMWKEYHYAYYDSVLKSYFMHAKKK